MPVPTAITVLSTTPGSNSPVGSESVGPNMNAYIQASYAFIAQLYQGGMVPTAAVNMNSQQLNNVANGTNPGDAVNLSQLGTYLPLAGGSLAGALTISSGNLFINSGSIVNTTVSAGMELGSTSVSNTPFMDFHSSGNNVDYDVRLIVTGGNGSVGQGAMSCFAAAGFTCSGNITSSSDARLKKDWRKFGPDFIEQFAKVRNGTYERKDTKQRQTGVSAQSLRKVMKDAVVADQKGMLSVAYGQAALAAAVELAKEIVALRKRIAKLEKKS